jgi:hypothetical protein
MTQSKYCSLEIPKPVNPHVAHNAIELGAVLWGYGGTATE